MGSLMELGGCDSPRMVKQLTVTERLENSKHALEEQLREINEALEAFKKNPELQTLLDIVSRARF